MITSKIMKKCKVTRILLTMFLSIWLLPEFAAADGISAGLEEREPLNNRELHQLRMELGGGNDMVKKIKGIEVKVKVSLHIRKDQTAYCKVLKPDEGRWRHHCAAHLCSFTPHFPSGLKEGEEYLLEGMIVEDRIDFGAFWIYANKLTRVEQGGAGQSATRPESKSEDGRMPQPETKGDSR